MSNQSSIQQAITTASEGDTKTAIAILRGLIKENPGSVDAWLALADIVEKPEQAKQCWERVLQIDPDNQIAQQKLSLPSEITEADNGYGRRSPAGGVWEMTLFKHYRD